MSFNLELSFKSLVQNSKHAVYKDSSSWFSKNFVNFLGLSTKIGDERNVSNDGGFDFTEEEAEDKASEANNDKKSKSGMVIFADDSDGFVGFNMHFVFGYFLEFRFRNGQLLSQFDVFNPFSLQKFWRLMQILDQLLHFLSRIKWTLISRLLFNVNLSWKLFIVLLLLPRAHFP